RGFAPEKIAALTDWDPFFIEKVRHLVLLESRLRESRRTRVLLAEAKRSGFADESLAALTRNSEERIRRDRPRAAYKMVDTCGGEFEARTPYFYSTYEATGETPRLRGRKVLIVGSGPVRIGQGVEFDYCCVQGIFALREEADAASGYSFEEVRGLAARIGYPVLVRPSYVLGGRGMEIVYTEEDLAGFMETAVRVSKDHPVLVDRYLAHATEIDVDVVADGRD